MTKHNEPNWQEARTFLERIAGACDPLMTFQAFDDKGERYELAAWKHGRLSDPTIRKFLERKADQGCGVYVVVSACDGLGRRRQNVTHARANFIDLDGEPRPAEWAVEPDIINETSPGKYHAFWLTQNVGDLNAFSDCQARLAAFYLADLRVFDPPRVVRLPGFYHQKKTPFRSRTTKICSAGNAEPFERRDMAEVAAAHECAYDPPSKRAEGGRSEEPEDGWDSPADIERARLYLENVKLPEVGNRNNAGYLVAAKLNDFGVSPEMSRELMLEIWNARLENPLEEHEILHVIKSAGIYKATSAGSKSVHAETAHDFADEDIAISHDDDEANFEGSPTAEELSAVGPDFDFEENPNFEEAPTQPKLKKTITREVGGISYSRADEIKAEPIRWLWPDRIPKGKLTLIAGYPDQGKSQIMLKVAALVTTGGEWPNGEGVAPKGAVIILSSEDDAADTLKPRLAAAGADLSNVYILQSMVKYIDEGKKRKRVLNIEDDLRNIQAIMKQIQNEGKRVEMIGLDPINAYFGGGKQGKADSHKNSDMRAMLTPISDWAAQMRVAIVAITHFNKGSNAHALHRITDSGAITAAARSVYIAVKKYSGNPDAEVERIFVTLKHNLAPDHIKGLSYIITNKDVSEITGVANPPHGTPYIEFGREDSTTAEEALNGIKPSKTRVPEALERAKTFLLEVLADGPMTTKKLKAVASQAGISWDTLTSRAAPAVGAVSFHPKGYQGEWAWKLVPLGVDGDELEDRDVDEHDFG